MNWQRGTLERNFSVSTALLVLLLIGATLLVLHERLDATLGNALEERAMSVARSIGAVATPSLLAYNYGALQISAEAAVGDPGVHYVVIHDKEGTVAGIAGKSFPAGIRDPLIDPPGGPQSAVVQVQAADGEELPVLEVAMPVFVANVEESWGTIRVGMSYAPVMAELRRLKWGLAALGVLLAVGSVAGVRLVARRITAPLRALVKATQALSSGELDYRLPVTGAREFAELSRAFNEMMGRLQDKARESAEFRRRLEGLNVNLEEQVRQRTRALQESVNQYETLVQHSPDSILIVQDRRICFVNKAFTETFGISVERALTDGFRLESLFESSSADLVNERLAAWQAGRSGDAVAVVAKDAKGATRELELRGSGIEYLGRPAAECLLVDLTEAKRLREKLNETEKLRALGELASGVAHDFNNLLGAILGRVQLLRRNEFPEDVDNSLAVIEKSAQDGRETVRRIQEFSRVRRDRERTPVDLRSILTDTIEITKTRWKDEAESRNVSIALKAELHEVPYVLGNAAEFREVFTNLILNAIDAMPDGGQLGISCFRERGSVVALVSDTGVGMTEDVRRQLFDPFFSTKGLTGTGLGLSVAYGVVGRQGGSIEVESAPGQGTCFRVEFPVAEVTPAAEAPAPRQERSATPGLILVIDDEPAIAEMIEMTLRTAGHAVDIALSGSEGVKMAASTAYDLVFSDLGMPDLSGWDVAEQILGARPAQPLVLITGWGATLDEQELAERGIAGVVHKPFDIGDLLDVTARALGRESPDGPVTGTVPKNPADDG